MSDVTQYGPAYDLVEATVLIVEGDAIVAVPLYYPRLAAFDEQITTIPFEGGGTSQTIDVLTRTDLALTCDKRNFPQIQQIYGKTRVEAPSGVGWAMDWGMWMGDEAEVGGVACGLVIDIPFKDESVVPNIVTRERVVYPLGQVKVVRMQQAEYQAKHVTLLNFSFQRTAVDLLGNALPGVPTGGAVRLDGVVDET